MVKSSDLIVLSLPFVSSYLAEDEKSGDLDLYLRMGNSVDIVLNKRYVGFIAALSARSVPTILFCLKFGERLSVLMKLFDCRKNLPDEFKASCSRCSDFIFSSV